MSGTVGGRVAYLDLARQGWRESAACAGQDPRQWDLDAPAELQRKGRRICGTCPVAVRCRGDITGDDYGTNRGNIRLTEEVTKRSKWGHRIHTKVCVHCGSTFGTRKSDAFLCGKPCVSGYHRARAAAKREAWLAEAA